MKRCFEYWLNSSSNQNHHQATLLQWMSNFVTRRWLISNLSLLLGVYVNCGNEMSGKFPMFEKNGSCQNQKLPMIDFVTPSSGIFYHVSSRVISWKLINYVASRTKSWGLILKNVPSQVYDIVVINRRVKTSCCLLSCGRLQYIVYLVEHQLQWEKGK